jgi:DHA1 family multidrug resistance protein-like MFS transporter
MFDILRESSVGEVLNLVSGGRILPYPDQRSDFVIPERYLATSSRASTSTPITRVPSAETLADKASIISGATATVTTGTNIAVEKVDTVGSDATLEAGPEPVETIDKSINTKGFQLVDWYGDEDPENPRNWSFTKRSFVMFEISLLTCVLLIPEASARAQTANTSLAFVVSLSISVLRYTRHLSHTSRRSSTSPMSWPL